MIIRKLSSPELNKLTYATSSPHVFTLISGSTPLVVFQLLTSHDSHIYIFPVVDQLVTHLIKTIQICVGFGILIYCFGKWCTNITRNKIILPETKKSHCGLLLFFVMTFSRSFVTPPWL